jgi:hypothetical protein
VIDMEIDMTKEPKPDFIVHAGEWATMWQFQPVSAQAVELVSELGIEDWQWMGGMFAVDHRPARDLARYIVGEGMTVYHPDYGYFGG